MPGPEFDLALLRTWIGRRTDRTDLIAPAPLGLLAATLDRDDPPPASGDPVPPLWHWLYHHAPVPQSALGADGHPIRGAFLPPVPLPRRMWAGSRFEFTRPIRVGDTITRASTIADVRHKAGRSGALVFVIVRHELGDAAGPALIEEQDIVYRDAGSGPGGPPRPAPDHADFSRELVADEVLLFRYSALTFNGHRIHYDRRYATEVEGYPGLVVHGPLLATLLLDLLRRERATAAVSRFEFRALRPLFDGTPFRLAGKWATGGRVELWAAGAGGALAMEATATVA